MIILYEENEIKFESLGIGVLKDAVTCYVKETLNDSFELEMSYPVSGSFYSELKIGRIIASKPNPFEDNQPFRIGYISKPIDGIVIVRAYHISYDMNGIVIGPVSANNLSELLSELKQKAVLDHNFTFHSDTLISKTFSTTNYYNLRSLLFGSEKSILETYEVDLKLDKFNVYLLKNRGKNNESQIRYGKNMTNLSHEISYERLYNGVYPYYHKETSSSNPTISSDEFTKAYIVGNRPLQDGWLSFSENGEPYHPLNESPIQIATSGEYYNKVFVWDSKKQKYVEKLYEQTVTLIEGVISPEWIVIDWSGLPNIVVKANKPGYFKMVTDTEYEYHDVGDIVFKGSIRTAMNALVIYYSEVIPGQTVDSNEVADSVEHIDLADKILWINTDLAKEMKFNRILPLDITNEFEEDEEVNEENIKKKALKYIEDNKIGQYKYTTSVSFIDLNSTTEDVIYKNLDKLEIGDTVKVVYDYIGVDIELRVISAAYNVLTDKYESIELGEKPEKISASSVQTGDSISSLSNDKGYTTVSEVNKIVANIITADYIQAKNAKLTKAQIEELESSRIRCTGILEASQFDIDKLVAKLLISDNAEIKNTLTAGNIKVSGDITVKSGEIYIQNDTGSKVFSVDREGNLVATSATIMGNIQATGGIIGGFTVNDTSMFNNVDSMESDADNGIYIGPDGFSFGKQLKMYSNGVVSSVPNLSNIDPNSNESVLIKTLVSEANDKYEYIGTNPKGSFTVEDINRYGIRSFNIKDVLNVKTNGSVINSDGTPLDVKIGDNIIVYTDASEQVLYWEKVSNSVYMETYAYQGRAKTSWLNHLLSLDPTTIKYGFIYYIDAKDEDLHNLVNGSNYDIFDVNVGDYVVFVYHSDQTKGQWYKFYYAEESSSTFFGITPNGILYANGAVISGDVTVKSGEISIQNENNTKVFRVDRDGNLYANSVTITGLANGLTIEGGEISIYDSNHVKNFYVSPQGLMAARNVSIEGGEFVIKHSNNNEKFKIADDGSVTIKDSSGNQKFKIDSGGSIDISAGHIKIGSTFEVTPAGVLSCSGATINGNVTSGNLQATGGKIAGLTINSDGFSLGSPSDENVIRMSTSGYLNLHRFIGGRSHYNTRFEPSYIQIDNRSIDMTYTPYQIPYTGILVNVDASEYNMEMEYCYRVGTVDIGGDNYKDILVSDKFWDTGLICFVSEKSEYHGSGDRQPEVFWTIVWHDNQTYIRISNDNGRAITASYLIFGKPKKNY